MDGYRVLVLDFVWKHHDWIDWTTPTLSEQLFSATGSATRRRAN